MSAETQFKFRANRFGARIITGYFIALALHSPTYFFSNSPVKWRFTKVVFPVPPSPTRTSYDRDMKGKEKIQYNKSSPYYSL